jgi:bacterioferritin-associated ferredoxin
VRICPGLAITLADYREDAANPIVTLPYEVGNYAIEAGTRVRAVDISGNDLGMMEVVKVLKNHKTKTQLIKIRVPAAATERVAGIRIQDEAVSAALPEAVFPAAVKDEAMVCVCERVTAKEVRDLIRQGITDINQLKAITRAGMGPCGAKTCSNLMNQLLREEGIKMEQVVANTRRPAFVEVPLGIFAGKKEKTNE